MEGLGSRHDFAIDEVKALVQWNPNWKLIFLILYRIPMLIKVFFLEVQLWHICCDLIQFRPVIK